MAKKPSVSQMTDLVMTINSVQKSSKSELSLGTFGPFKVCVEECRYKVVNQVKLVDLVDQFHQVENRKVSC